MNPWISGSFAILGVVVGGLLSYIANLHKTSVENQWKRDENLLTRFEEIYETAEAVKEGFFKAGTSGIAKAHFNTPLPESTTIPVTKLKTLIDFYIPEAKKQFADLEKAREVFGNIYAEVITTPSFSTLKAQDLSSHLMQGAKQIEDACIAIQAVVLKVSQSLRVTRASR